MVPYVDVYRAPHCAPIQGLHTGAVRDCLVRWVIPALLAILHDDGLGCRCTARHLLHGDTICRTEEHTTEEERL